MARPPLLPFDQQPSPYIVPRCEETVTILYEDNDLLVINKPDLLLSVPGRLPENKDCMITRIQKTHPTASVVHRLDLDTSGIMLVPLNRESHAELSRQFQSRRIDKTYTAELYGILREDRGRIDLPIACDWQRRPLQKICYQQGRNALTEFSVLQRDYANHRTRVLLHPITGRSHQLRIHTKQMGHPILGCDMYAHLDALYSAERLLLHATDIRFFHPRTQLAMKMHSEPPF